VKNRCAYCQGKFGLVRHRPAFKSFCSQKCVDHHQVWLRAEVCKRKGWLDCLWSANVDVMPCLRTASGQTRICRSERIRSAVHSIPALPGSIPEDSFPAHLVDDNVLYHS
jgi:hypothetical protein